MRIGVYQFASTNITADNLQHIRLAVSEAYSRQVRLLVFHECALCGYPPIEANIDKISKSETEKAVCEVAALAKTYKMFIAVGTVRFSGKNRYNSIAVINDNGNVIGFYDKKSLWGWDTENFSRGTNKGVFEIDSLKVGFRICFDVRFPELFRELYKEETDICFVSFSDTAESPSNERYNIIKSHLVTRAAENVMTVISINSITNFQTAPTAVFDCNGNVIKEAKIGREELLVYDYDRQKITFSAEGRIANSNFFIK